MTRPHLGAEETQPNRPLQQGVELRDRLHELDAVLLRVQSLIDFEERDDVFVVQR